MENLLEIDNMILDEVYIGKTKGLQAIESELDSFRNRYMDNHWNMHINNDSQLIKINRMFEEEFGFGVFCLHIINDRRINAFTLPIDTRFDVLSGQGNLVVEKSGYKFKKSAGYAAMVMINSGIIFNKHFTTGEVMAVILHEIGHNFFSAINRNNGILADIYKTYIVAILITKISEGKIPLDGLLSINSFDKMLLEVIDDARSNKKFGSTILDIIEHANNIITYIIQVAGTAINILSFNILMAVLKTVSAVKRATNPITYLSLFVGYRNERAADNFPTMYGYGQDLSSALRKFEEAGYEASNVMNTINTVPIVSTLFRSIDLVPSILISFFDQHPSTISRVSDQMALLKRELNSSSIDPKMEKTIRADIAEIEKQIKLATDTTKGVKDPDITRHLYYRFLYTYMDCKEIKDRLLDDKNKFYEYDKVFYDNLR